MKVTKDQLTKIMLDKVEKLSSPEDLFLLLQEIADWSPNYYDVGEIVMGVYLKMLEKKAQETIVYLHR
jgi:hypothetical protein